MDEWQKQELRRRMTEIALLLLYVILVPILSWVLSVSFNGDWYFCFDCWRHGGYR